MNASSVIVSKKTAAMEAVNQLIRSSSTDSVTEGIVPTDQNCIVTNPVSNELTEMLASEGEPVVASTEEVVKTPKKKAAPKKSKKDVEEVVPVEGEPVVASTEEVVKTPKKKAAPKKSKKDTEEVVPVEGEPVVASTEEVVKTPKKRAAPKKSKKNAEEIVDSVYLVADETIVVQDVVQEVVQEVEISSTKKKIQYVRDPIHYLKSFIHNVHNTPSFPEEIKESFQSWLNSLDNENWKSMSVFPSYQTRSVTKLPAELVVEGLRPSDQEKKEENTQVLEDSEEFEEIELIVEETVIDGELYLIDSNQDLYDPVTFAYIRNLNYAT